MYHKIRINTNLRLLLLNEPQCCLCGRGGTFKCFVALGAARRGGRPDNSGAAVAAWQPARPAVTMTSHQHIRDLFCSQNFQEEEEEEASLARLCVTAQEDHNLLQDHRVLNNLLFREKFQHREDYFSTVQTKLKPHMRKIVTDWMLEVCQDHQCQPQVFFLAVNYLDRFLSSVAISKTQFQLCAAVCILLASKFSQVVPISTEKLAVYTDHSVTTEELRLWEVQVLAVLEWELSSVTAHSFLEQLTSRAGLLGSQVSSRTLYSQAETIAALAATEYKFVLARQSVLAAAALAAAVREEGRLEEEEVVKRLAMEVESSVSEITFYQRHLTALCHQLSWLDPATGKEVEHCQQDTAPPRPAAPATPTDCLTVLHVVAA